MSATDRPDPTLDQARAMQRIRTPEDLSRAVRARRKLLGLTQKELALAAGVGRVSVLRLENEPEKSQLQTALRIAEVLRLDLSARSETEADAVSARRALSAEPPAQRAAPAGGYGRLPFELVEEDAPAEDRA